MINIKPDIKNLQNQLAERMKKSGWLDKLKGFILSADFGYILETLWQNKQEGRRFVPSLAQMFRAFEETNFNDLKVIFLFQDPYFSINKDISVADGLATSCSNTMKLQPTLEYMLNEVSRTVYPGEPYKFNPDLKRWANQGVLLLNLALSVEVGKAGSHLQIWQPFMAYLLDILNLTQSGLIWVGFGAHAKKHLKQINTNTHFKFELSHPASAAYDYSKKWDCCDVFNEINKILINNDQAQIIW